MSLPKELLHIYFFITFNGLFKWLAHALCTYLTLIVTSLGASWKKKKHGRLTHKCSQSLIWFYAFFRHSSANEVIWDLLNIYVQCAKKPSCCWKLCVWDLKTLYLGFGNKTFSGGVLAIFKVSILCQNIDRLFSQWSWIENQESLHTKDWER